MENTQKYAFKLNFFYSTNEIAAILDINLDEFFENRALYMNNLAEFYEYKYECPKGYIFIRKIADYIPPDKRKEILEERKAAIRNYIIKCVKSDPLQTAWSTMQLCLHDKEDTSVTKFNIPLNALRLYFEDIYFKMLADKEIEDENRVFCYWDADKIKYIPIPDIEDRLVKEAFARAFSFAKYEMGISDFEESTKEAQKRIASELPTLMEELREKENIKCGVIFKQKVRDPAQ